MRSLSPFRTVAICATSVVVVALASCSSIAQNDGPKCAFEYAQVRDSIVVPAMRAVIGERTKLYDTDKPLTHPERGSRRSRSIIVTNGS
jgi:hypothetical protein